MCIDLEFCSDLSYGLKRHLLIGFKHHLDSSVQTVKGTASRGSGWEHILGKLDDMVVNESSLLICIF